MKREVRTYKNFTDDFYRTGEPRRLPESYRFVRDDVWSKIISSVIYGAALVFSAVYCRVCLHLRIVGKKKLRACRKTGVFLYGNHTQPIGDVFDPALVCFPKRIYTVASADNLTLPGIGKILPYLGIIPVPDSFSGMRQFGAALNKRLTQNACIVIYPEAHVWDYCSFIRPFPVTSFKYPVQQGKPAFCLTATYKKRRFGDKPSLVLYLDGPFLPGKDGSVNARASALHDTVYECMVKRSRQTDCRYINYRPACDKQQ